MFTTTARVLAAALLSPLLVACAGLNTKAYEPPNLALETPADDVFHAVERHARKRGWQVVRANRQQRELEALAAPVSEEGVLTREHWQFRVVGTGLSVRRNFQVKFTDESPWEQSEVVCDGYTYLREWEELSAIGQSLGVAVVVQSPGDDRMDLGG